MTSWSARLRLACLCAVALVAVEVSAQDVRIWLDRMSTAVEELDYEGTFVHLLGDNTETLHIVHRNDGGRISERIVSLDEAGREIIRQDHEIRCILPDQGVVLLEQTRDISPLVSALPNYSEELDPHYDLRVVKSARVAKRPTQVIVIRPKDQYRYGYVLWLDEETAMPLKTKLVDENGEVIEQVLFTQFEVLDAVPGSAFESTIDTDGFTWFHPPASEPLAPGSVTWRAASLPGGFKLSVAKQSSIAGGRYPVDHLVYSDGLATVSVFIEDPKTDAEVTEGFTRVGSSNAYSLTLDGRKVTAIGEVPRETVRTIAASLTAE